MVHTRKAIPTTKEGEIDIDRWIDHLSLDPAQRPLIKNACQLAKLLGEDRPTRFGSNCFLQGLELAEILSEMSLDAESIATAIIYSTAKSTDLSAEDIAEQLSPNVAKLVAGLLKLGVLNLSQKKFQEQSSQQIDNIRKMILAMVQDVRVVVIKLAERLSMMRTLKNFSPEFQEHIANETMKIFAPLANRLGLHQIKWELEDRAFFHLEPETYKHIAKHLDETRLDRNRRVKHIVKLLNVELEKHDIQAKVYGRAKHIYSIRRKMQRKKVDFKQIYDAIAVRVLVNKTDDCYKTLGLAHQLWTPIPEEFDDYVTTPKPNGYRSIHTAVIDEDDKFFEIQIRTHEMHEQAEMGVAAHWIYKEGAKKASAYEEKIAWLRELLAWQKEVTNQETAQEKLDKNLLEDRVYVFTPSNDVIDLPTGATPLDFAYHIHTQVGHRCRGAKVNGNIVPLTYQLVMGDKVEILTNKQGTPSRDWMLPQRGYLKTSTARAKVLHWFKNRDFEQHVRTGRELLEKEQQRLHLPDINYQLIAAKLKFKTADQMFSALALGHLKLAHIIHIIEAEYLITTTDKLANEPILAKPTTKTNSHDAISIHGVNHLLTKIARCCKPIPGDPIIGYITQSDGITIHHINCKNIGYAEEHQAKRLIDVDWNVMTRKNYAIDLEILAHDRDNLLRDISTSFANEQIKMTNLTAHLNPLKGLVKFKVVIEIENLDALDKTIARIQQIPDVLSVQRLAR